MDDIDHIAEMTINEVISRWPATAAVFSKSNMACAGCAVAGYYTVVDAAQVYGLPVDDFLASLKEAALFATAA